MPTSYTTRPSITPTPYGIERVGGAWLKDKDGKYVVDTLGRRIVVARKGGSLPLTVYTTRLTPL